MVDPRGGNIGGCCLSITLGDYARMGQFVLEGGKGAVPEGWFAEATDSAVDFGTSGFGYGYQWWTYPQGTFEPKGSSVRASRCFPTSAWSSPMSATGPRPAAGRSAGSSSI